MGSRSGLLYGHDALVAEWVQRQCGGGKIAELSTAIGYFSRGEIAAGIMYFCQRERDIQMALAVRQPTPFDLGFVGAFREVLRYPFRQLGLPRISAEIDEANETSWRQAIGWGFVVEGAKPFAGVGGGRVLMLGLYPHARFIR